MSAPKDPVAYALWKQRMSEARKGKKNGNYGKPMSDENRKHLSEVMTGRYSGENNPMYGVRLIGERNHNFGKHMPEETRQKISEAMAGRTAWNKGLPSPWTKGIPRSDETKAKISASNIGKNHGKPAWNKGIPFSEESKQKMSNAKLGKKMSDEFKEKRSEIMKEKWTDQSFRADMVEKHIGENNANFGKPLSDEQKQKLSEWERTPEYLEKLRQARIGKIASVETRTKMSESHAGDKCYNWKGGITPLYRHIRGRLEYKRWCNDLLQKHDYTDTFTNERGGILSCHHVIPVNLIIRMNNVQTIEDALACSLIWDLNNGIVMLKSAHDKFHNIYGDDKVIYELTDEQIQELYQ